MHFLIELWMPIVLSAAFVFVVSSVLHMVVPIHRNDCKKLPNEDLVLSDMRKHGVVPGDYVFPCPGSMKEMGSPEMVEKYKQGPVGFLTVMPSRTFKMGICLTQWFLYSLLVSVFAAYITHAALAPGASCLAVFRLAGTVAVAVYGVSYIPNSIWKGTGWTTTLKFIFDGIIYGLVTAGTFGWLWPGVVH